MACGPKDKWEDFSNGQAWHWKLRWWEVQTTFLLDAKRLRISELGWPSRRCQISVEVGKLMERKACGIDVAEDFKRI
jgi:hypothetical protein